MYILFFLFCSEECDVFIFLNFRILGNSGYKHSISRIFKKRSLHMHPSRMLHILLCSNLRSDRWSLITSRRWRMLWSRACMSLYLHAPRYTVPASCPWGFVDEHRERCLSTKGTQIPALRKYLMFTCSIIPLGSMGIPESGTLNTYKLHMWFSYVLQFGWLLYGPSVHDYSRMALQSAVWWRERTTDVRNSLPVTEHEILAFNYWNFDLFFCCHWPVNACPIRLP